MKERVIMKFLVEFASANGHNPHSVVVEAESFSDLFSKTAEAVGEYDLPKDLWVRIKQEEDVTVELLKKAGTETTELLKKAGSELQNFAKKFSEDWKEAFSKRS